ncbi:protein FAM184B-like, partial [Aedes aegypti]|uniref:Uncharacterized protein n=1 Tax=Aedes aegypti TaxID=7159 RepID=A0A903VSR5_AEDAE
EKDPNNSSDEESEAEDAISVDDTIDETGKSGTEKFKTISEDEEVSAALKRMKVEKERLKRKMEQKLALARAQIDLENEKLEMEWVLEKQILEMKIASKSVFQKKKEMEKKKLQDQLKQLCDSEVRVESEIQKLQNQKKEAKRLATNSKVTRVAKFEELPIGPLSSTPIADPEEGTSTAGTKKKTDRLQSTISIVKKKGHEAKKEETESKEECESEEGSFLDNSLVEDLGESSSCNTSEEEEIDEKK